MYSYQVWLYIQVSPTFWVCPWKLGGYLQESRPVDLVFIRKMMIKHQIRGVSVSPMFRANQFVFSAQIEHSCGEPPISQPFGVWFGGPHCRLNSEDCLASTVYVKTDMGVSIVMGVPNTGWLISWNIPLKWMLMGDTPILGNPHIHSTYMCIKVPPSYTLAPNSHQLEGNLWYFNPAWVQRPSTSSCSFRAVSKTLAGLLWWGILPTKYIGAYHNPIADFYQPTSCPTTGTTIPGTQTAWKSLIFV